jgi:iron complex outermembrane receptor protein
VTAQKRSENIQKVPISVTAISGAALQARNINNIVDVAAVTPGLQLQIGQGVVVPFVRGVGNPSTTAGNESSVAMYVDGVYFAHLPPGFFSLANVDRIEILKGPQGTLFGRNSSGGVIQIVTPDPSYRSGVKGHIGYGSYDTLQGDLYATAGLSDKVALDVSVAGQRQGQGYGRNVITGHRANYLDNFIIRSKLLVEPTATTKAVLSGFYYYVNATTLGNMYPGFSQGYVAPPYGLLPKIGFYDQQSNNDNYDEEKGWGLSLKITQDLGFARLSSITAYNHQRTHFPEDIDYGPRADFYDNIVSGSEEFTQELQLASLKPSRLTWAVGAFYYNTLTHPAIASVEGYILPGGLGTAGQHVSTLTRYGEQRARSIAGYGQATYEIIPKLKLTGGIRYTHDNLSGSGQSITSLFHGSTVIPGAVVRAADSLGKVTFRTAIDYEFTPDVLGYFSFSRGYKAPVYNVAPFSATPAKPEGVDAYEIGLKSELFERRLRLNMAAFWQDIKNPQVTVGQTIGIFLSNAQSARIKGFEAEGDALIAPGLIVNFGVTYLDAKYLEYGTVVNGVCVGCSPYFAPNTNTNPAFPIGGSKLTLVPVGGNHMPNAPRFSASLGVQYSRRTAIGEWIVAADYKYTDRIYWNPDNLMVQEPYNMVNAQLVYRPNDHLSFSVWGKNLAGEKYVTIAWEQAGPSAYAFNAGAPRTYGVTAGFKF